MINAPESIEGAAAWSIATICLTVGATYATVDFTGALAVAREQGHDGETIAELLGAIQQGMIAGQEQRRQREKEQGTDGG